MIPLLLFAAAACLPVAPDASDIHASDLAPVLPGLSVENAAVSAAPAAGAPRLFEIPELRRIGAHFHAAGEPLGALCFERPLRPVDPTLLVEAMRRELPESRIELVDYLHASAPEGRMEFPLAGLQRVKDGAFWSGSIRYGGGRRFSLWARVRVTVSVALVAAVENLRPGPAIDARQLRLETRGVFPGEKNFADVLEQVAGRTVRIPVSSGTAIRLDWLAAPQDVLRGDRVVVEAHSGAALLRLECVAESSGSVGATIAVTNPSSGRRFQARVEGKGRVSVGKGQS